MTIGRGMECSTQIVKDPYHPMFSYRMIEAGRIWSLFTEDPDLEKQRPWPLLLYVMKKYFSCPYNEVLTMDPDDRNMLFDMQMDILKKDKEQSTGKKEI